MLFGFMRTEKQNIHDLVVKYLRAYYNFLDTTDITDSGEAKDLFCYCIKKIYFIETVELNEKMMKYVNICKKDLEACSIFNGSMVNFSESVGVVSLCIAYANTVDFLTTGNCTDEFLRGELMKLIYFNKM